MKDLSFFNGLPLAQQQMFLNGPALQPPPGVTRNLAHPPNQNAVGYGVVISCAILTTSLVIARLYARAFYHKKIELEDYCAVGALGALAGFFYCSWMTFISPGLLVHQWNITVLQLFDALYYMNVGSTIYGNVIMCLKVGILLEWSKTFVPRGFKNGFWWTCHVLIGINVVFYVICTFVEIFGCTPREKLWRPILPGKCVDMPKLNIVSASINFTSDIIILLLPQRVIWGLQMSITKRLSVAALFAVGIFGSVCAGIRIHSAIRFSISDDIMYNAGDMGLWCIAEMTAGFFVLCIPSLRKMFTDSPWIQKFVSTLRSTTSSFSSSANKSSQQSLPSMESAPRKPRTANDILYSGWDRDTTPLSSISVKSTRSVSTGPMGDRQSM